MLSLIFFYLINLLIINAQFIIFQIQYFFLINSHYLIHKLINQINHHLYSHFLSLYLIFIQNLSIFIL